MVGRIGLLKSGLMAGIALDREPLELPDRSALMTVRAVQAGVSTNQGKPIFVFPDPLNDETPALHGMTLLAVGAHLTAMDIGMAIGAVRARIRKHRLGVTLGAGHALMQTAERVLRSVVIEFRNRADGLPSRRGVAVLTGNTEVTVRTARHGGTASLAKSGSQTAAYHQIHRSQDKGCRRE